MPAAPEAVAHRSKTSRGQEEHRVINLLSRVFEARLDVLTLKVGIALEDICFRGPGRKQVEHVFYPDAHAPDARKPGASFGIERDAVQLAHPPNLSRNPVPGKRAVTIVFGLGVSQGLNP
jgi:hypothetical protein